MIGDDQIASVQLNFNSTPAKVFKSDLTLGNPSYWNTLSGAVIDLGSFEISGETNFTAFAGSTLKSGHPSGLDGSIKVSGIINLSAKCDI
ncbi:MAG: hypothetical protein IPI12_02205 [Ignavibacteriales bacterium]|nr:hypothetical protein [Ignavibacteriales bacterium]